MNSDSNGRIFIRSDRFQKHWQYDSPANNPDSTQRAVRPSADAAEQQIRPFYGQTQKGLPVDNREHYQRRMDHGMPGGAQHGRLELLLRYETEVRLHGPGSKLATLLSEQLDAYDNRHVDTKTVHKK